MNSTISLGKESTLATNKLIRNTYTLLSMTLLFSAAMAALGVVFQVPYGISIVCSIGAIALLWFVLPRVANSASGIYVVFAVTGMLGLGLGPMLSAYLSLPNGPSLVALAMGGTGGIFLGLSAYALSTKSDFNFMGGFLVAGFVAVLVVMLANLFIQSSMLQLAICGVVILLMSGFILYDTSRMVNGHENNYILMTVSLYLSIYNIFVSLLQILGITSDD